MTRAYSQDLRDRVIDAVNEDGLSRRSAAAHFGVSVSSAIKWLQAFEREGRRTPTGRRGRPPLKLASERDWLLAEIVAKPDLTLEGLAARLWEARAVSASVSMLWRFFKREGISFKKNRVRQRAKQARRRLPAQAVEEVSRSP